MYHNIDEFVYCGDYVFLEKSSCVAKGEKNETPQELGLFGTLVYGGHKKTKAMLYSFAAQSTVILGGIVGAHRLDSGASIHR